MSNESASAPFHSVGQRIAVAVGRRDRGADVGVRQACSLLLLKRARPARKSGDPVGYVRVRHPRDPQRDQSPEPSSLLARIWAS